MTVYLYATFTQGFDSIRQECKEKQNNLQFNLSHAAVTLNFDEGHRNWYASIKVKLNGGYYYANEIWIGVNYLP